jgi:hypothetical protein
MVVMLALSYTVFYSINGTKVDLKKSNRLDREGFRVLFDLHTQSVRSKVVELFEDVRKISKSMESASLNDFLVKEIKEVIYESRSKLDIFQVDGIPDLNDFLESNLSSEKLDKLIREAVNIVLSSGDSDEQKKRAIEYVKRTQIGLLKQINTKIIDEI